MGSGSAAFAAGIKTADIGARVLIVEDNVIGGTCLDRGCIPSKYLIEVANTFYTPSKNPFPGVELAAGNLNIRDIIEKKEELLKELRKEKYWNVLEAYPQIEYKNLRGKFLDKGVALVGEDKVNFGKAIIAIGSKPGIPPGKGIEKVRYYTSDSIFDIDHLPGRLIMIGGGAIGLEQLGQAFLRLGSEVTIVESFQEIAMLQEPEIRTKLKEILEKEGMNILTSAKVNNVCEENGKLTLEVEHEGKKITIYGTDLLIATGREPNTKDIGLEAISVMTNTRGFIQANEFMQTTNKDIYAAGDCVGKMMLVTVAAMEGGIAAENALLGNKKKADYLSVPNAIFTDPEVAKVGMDEVEARKRGLEVETRVLDFSKVPRAAISLQTEGLVKMVVEKNSGKIIGIHILAPHGAEIIHKAAILVKYGFTIDDVVQMVDVYPTLSESIKLCAQSFKKDIAKLLCCAE